NPDGSLDRSFGGTGEVFGPGGFILDLAIQPGGKILAGGYSGGNFALARYNADGSLDQTFGTRGLATTDIGRRSNDWLEAVGLQADGKIVAAGSTRDPRSTTDELALVRYNADGTLDTSFGTGGKALDHLVTQLQGQKMGLALDPATGAIVVQTA